MASTLRDELASLKIERREAVRAITAAEHVLALEHLQAFTVPDQPSAYATAGSRRGLGRLAIGNERIAKAVHCPDEQWIVRVVTDRAANLGHQAVQRDLRDVGVGPQPRVNVVLRDGIGTPLDEHGQQIECLSRQLELAAAAGDAACRGIERQVVKRQGHRGNRAQYQRCRMRTQ